MNKERFNTRDAAEYLGFVPHTMLRKCRSTGVLYGNSAPKYKKAGHKVYYEKSELDRWLSQFRERASTSDESINE